MIRAARPRDGLVGNRGSALLAVMCFATVLVLALTTFQALCYQTFQTSTRNAQSTHAIELAEMGMEYAIWTRNRPTASTSYAADWSGWTISGSTASITLSGATYNFSNGVTGSIALVVTNYNGTNATTSEVTSTGTATLLDGSTVSRQLKATLKKTETFANAIASASATTTGVSALYLGTNGSGAATVDGYTSSTAILETNYPTTFTTDYSAVVAGYSVTLQNKAVLNGYVATTPLSNGTVNLSYTTGTSGSKLKGPGTSGTLNIDYTRQTTNFNHNFFDVPTLSASVTYYTQPANATALAAAKVLYGSNAWFALAAPSTNTDVYLGETGSTTWYRTAGSLSIGNNNGRFIIDGTSVVIMVFGDFTIGNNGNQIIIRNGGSLRLMIRDTGQIYYAGIDNQTKLPKNLTIIGTGTSTGTATIWVWSYTNFVGTIYAPRHAVRVWGYSSPTAQFFGAIVGNSVIIDPYSLAILKFHYDKDLSTEIVNEIPTPYVVQGGTLKEYNIATGAEL